MPDVAGMLGLHLYYKNKKKRDVKCRLLIDFSLVDSNSWLSVDYTEQTKNLHGGKNTTFIRKKRTVSAG